MKETEFDDMKDGMQEVIRENRLRIKELELALETLSLERSKLRLLACERCKLTKMAFACRINDEQCLAFDSKGAGLDAT